MTLKEWYCHRQSIIDSFRMQLTVFENGTCTLSCTRSTEDHFICERYKDQIIPSKRKSINVMAQRFSTKEWQQRSCSVPSVRCINYQRAALNNPQKDYPDCEGEYHSIYEFTCDFLLANINNSLLKVGAIRCMAIICNVIEILSHTKKGNGFRLYPVWTNTILG